MDERKKNDLINETVLATPKPKATSTVKRKSTAGTKSISINSEQSFESFTFSSAQLDKICQDLSRERMLASESLQRASDKFQGLPSMYLKPSPITPFKNEDDSSINESDLLESIQECSTPRHSNAKQSLSESIAQLSHIVQNPKFTIDDFNENFRKTMNLDDGNSFRTNASSLLRADEIAWRKQNELSIQSEPFSSIGDVEKESIGEYFMKGSDTLSDIAVNMDEKCRPLALINASNQHNQLNSSSSLSVTGIQKILEMNYSINQAIKLLADPPKNFRKSKNSDILPVSKDSSYTSNHSDNEPLKQLVLNKENIETTTTSSKSSKGDCESRSSSRALTSLSNGKLPLESTVMELTWGCVKIGKSSTQEFYIRNKSDKKMGIQLLVTGHDFKIRKDMTTESEATNNAKILLRAFESKTISVSFIPTKIGAAVDQLYFKALNPTVEQSKKQYIKLFGYGGHDRIEFMGITKDTTGKYWLSLGKINNTEQMSQTFSIKNIGTLPTFIYITNINKDVAHIKVNPNFFTIIPQEEKSITVEYILTLQSYKERFSNNVCEITNLLVVSGSEANRGRLRKLSQKLKETDGIVKHSLGDVLIQNIKGEVMPKDLEKIRENVSAYSKICQFFTRTEVVVTVERDPDQTILPQGDETMFYQTLCDGESVLENTVIHMSFRLEPSVVFLTPPKKQEDFLFLTSTSSRLVRFEVKCEPEGLEIIPNCGHLSCDQEVSLIVKCTRIQNISSFKIKVHVENEVLQAVVNIKQAY